MNSKKTTMTTSHPFGPRSEMLGNDVVRFGGRESFSRVSFLSPAKAGLSLKSNDIPRVLRALLASPWATRLRSLRRLIEISDPRWCFAVTVLFVSAVVTLTTPFATRAQSDLRAPGQSAQAVAPSDAASKTSEPYRLGAGDVLDIRILNRPQLSRDSVRIDGNGMIRMPLIEGEIQAACKSEGELAKEIATRYLKYYRNAQVDVFVKEFHAREVALIGAVNQQGRYQMQRRLRLLELLTFAKGPSDKAGQTINIVRGPRTDLCTNSSDSRDEAGGFISLRLNDTLRGEEKANPYMEAGDIVTIPEADQVYVVGNVYHPQAIPIKEPITVSHAVAMAGGPLRDSRTDRIHIISQVPGSGGQSEVYVSLKDIASKKTEDVLLRPNDIVEVSESTGKSMLRALMGTAAQLPIRVIP